MNMNVFLCRIIFSGGVREAVGYTLRWYTATIQTLTTFGTYDEFQHYLARKLGKAPSGTWLLPFSGHAEIKVCRTLDS